MSGYILPRLLLISAVELLFAAIAQSALPVSPTQAQPPGEPDRPTAPFYGITVQTVLTATTDTRFGQLAFNQPRGLLVASVAPSTPRGDSQYRTVEILELEPLYAKVFLPALLKR